MTAHQLIGELVVDPFTDAGVLVEVWRPEAGWDRGRLLHLAAVENGAAGFAAVVNLAAQAIARSIVEDITERAAARLEARNIPLVLIDP